MFTFGQSFAPAPGEPGSTAVHMDSNVISGWANTCEVERGYLNIDSTHLGFADFGLPADAQGQAHGTVSGSVSLGDGGVATLHFFPPIENGPGPDFAIFENGFADHYMELAFVEVSSDGVNFVRFPAYSEAPTDVQLSNASYSDCRYVHNLAGKYRAGFGTPFDLDEVIDSAGLDMTSIAYVRIIDCVGKIDGPHVRFDHLGRPINDPFPTPFSSGGFDLDAVAVLNQGTMGMPEKESNPLGFVSPFGASLQLNSTTAVDYRVFSLHGKEMIVGSLDEDEFVSINTTTWPDGVYLLQMNWGRNGQTVRIVKN